MKDPDLELYWEDVGERLLYAVIDDHAWSLAENIFNYKKGKRLYIFHDNKLAAFYSGEDAKKEAEIGFRFYSQPENRSSVVELKKNIRDEIDNTDSTRMNISDEELLAECIKWLGLFSRALSTHYLSMPVFFTEFEKESDKWQEQLMEVSNARLEETRYAWTTAMKEAKKNLGELAKRKKVDIGLLESCTLDELKRNDFSKANSRKDKFVLVSNSGVQEILIGDIVDEYKQKYEQFSQKEVKGIIANKGVVRGHAFVVKNENLDFSKLPSGMEQGDILVVQNAWPEFTPYYDKASAIVTNEGGITSHGAVVAREKEIPCIVGTRIATKIFKSGDSIEVDANKGIVRRINE